MSTNNQLGQRVHEHLLSIGVETPMAASFTADPDVTTIRIQEEFRSIMGHLGLNLEDDSLMDTPRRVGKMFAKELFKGLDYNNFPACTVVENKMNYDEMVCEDQVQVQSMCEHHFLPIIGFGTVAYIPHKKVLGLSKINRIVDFFSRRPQIQERLTEQVAATLKFILETDDVAVIISAEHFCVKIRGIEDPCSNTITSKMSGRFRTVPELRAELLALRQR